MDYITSILLSGVIYDLLKKGVKLTFQCVFGRNFCGNRIEEDVCICKEFLEVIDGVDNLLNKKSIVQQILSEDNKYTNTFENDLYNTNFAKRLDYIIYVINSTNKYGKTINIEYLGEFLGFDSANDLLKYYRYEQEPTYRFCEDIANKLGVDPEWLKNGRLGDRIFQTYLPRIYYADEIWENNDCVKYEIHFIIKGNESKREIIVVRKYDEIKFEYYPCPLVFNSRVGASGMSSLLSLYRFLKSVATVGGNEILNVHIVPEDSFYDILAGKEYCGIINKYNSKELKNILLDFVDIYHENFSTKDYAEWYGSDFVKTQEIVAAMLLPEK